MLHDWWSPIRSGRWPQKPTCQPEASARRAKGAELAAPAPQLNFAFRTFPSHPGHRSIALEDCNLNSPWPTSYSPAGRMSPNHSI